MYSSKQDGEMLLTLEEKVDPENAALLVVDMQNDFCHLEGSLAKRGRDMTLGLQMAPRLVKLIEEARQAKVPVVFIRQTLSESTTSPASRERRLKRMPDEVELPLQEDSWGAEYYEVAPQPGECVVTKHRYSAFIDTNLDLILRSQGIKTLIMTGVATNVCVESTARDGFMKDYYVVFVGDCTAAERIEDHEATLRTMGVFFGEVVPSSEVIDAWRRIKQP
ncbi:cysteine hydrolase family protein [Chloroflexota bacterium]